MEEVTSDEPLYEALSELDAHFQTPSSTSLTWRQLLFLSVASSFCGITVWYTVSSSEVLPGGWYVSNQETTEPRNTGPWLADKQSRDLNNELWLAVYLIRSVPVSKSDALSYWTSTLCGMANMVEHHCQKSSKTTIHILLVIESPENYPRRYIKLHLDYIKSDLLSSG